jgi:hypothetical protein
MRNTVRINQEQAKTMIQKMAYNETKVGNLVALEGA